MNLFERIIFWLVTAAIVILAGVYFFNHTVPPEMPTSWDYKDVVALLLGVVTAGLTVVGIIIAIAAFWSYQQITQAASERAEKASKETTDQFLSSATFQTRLDILISERMKNMRKDEIEPGLNVTADGQPEAAPAGDQPWNDQ